MSLSAAAIRAQFPILDRHIEDANGGQRPLVFMDHGASTHAPKPVLDAVMDLHTQHYANIHRGNHHLSIESSDLFDGAAESFADFMGARSQLDSGDAGFVMLQNTTDALTLAAHLMKDTPGVTLTTLMEHHSNDLPHRAHGDVVHADIDEQGRVRMDDFETKLQEHNVKLVAVTGASNVTGYFPPIHEMARLAHEHDAKILVDAAQLYAHKPIDIKPRDHPEHIDMLAAAGHKAYAPFGSSFLFAPMDVINNAPPYMPGGGTVEWVTDQSTWFTNGPDRHMGGTPNITGVVAFRAATEWLAGLGMDAVREHEVELTEYGLRRFEDLADRFNVELLGPTDAAEKAGVFSFMTPDQPHDVVSQHLSNHYGIATRNGCFCAHPLLHRLLKLGDTSYWTDALSAGKDVELPGATRATVGIYNTFEEVDLLHGAIADIAAGKYGSAPRTDRKGKVIEVS